MCVLTCSFGIGQTWSLKEDADYFGTEEEFSKDDEKKVEESPTFPFKTGKSKRQHGRNHQINKIS